MGDTNPTNVANPLSDRLFRRHISTLKRSHFIFMFIQALISTLFIVGTAIWVNYKSIFQSGLIGYFHVLTGVLIGLYLGGNTILRLSFNRIQDNSVVIDTLTGKKYKAEDIRVLQEYEVYSNGSAVIITIAIIGSLLVAIYIYNLIYIIAVICPQHHHPHSFPPPHHHDIKGVSMTTPEGDLISNIQVILSYSRLPKDEYYAKRSVITLDYNESGHQVFFKEKDSNPNLYENLYEANEWIRFLNDDNANYGIKARNKSTSHDDNNGEEEGGVIRYKSSSQGGDLVNTICYNHTPKTYRIIENEINRYLKKSIEDRQNRKTFRIKDNHPNPHMNNEEEDDIFIDLFTKTLCRNEYGFMITILILLITSIIINIAIVIYNIWLRCIYSSNKFTY